jgi:tRNA (guanine-N7-)-methyltransferase
MARVRVHQHVNPHSPYYTRPQEPVDLAEAFADPELPLHLDVGCARGRFILRMADALPTWNFLGVEIREPLVDEANRLAGEAGLDNLHYVFCNAMIALGQLLADIPDGRLRMVTIQFPDPWFKKRHAKRRMVNAELVKTVVNKLAPSGQIFVQTDIEFLADEMFELFRADGRLIELAAVRSPFPVKTEREKAVEDKELPVYRAIFEKADAGLVQNGKIGPDY